jgi:hypothetical protein
VRRVLEGIARDEARHAQPAWHVVSWILSSTPELGVDGAAAFEQARLGADFLDRSTSEPDSLASHGMLSASEQQSLRRRVMDQVVGPCARALLARHGQSPPRSARV